MTYMLHRRRARRCYDIMNDVGNTFTVCFDIMENLVLLKCAIGQTYYSRQLYLYVFGVVRHHGRGEYQGKDDIHLDVWLEHQHRKDSNLVASALQHYFGYVVNEVLGQFELLRLFSDSCYGRGANLITSSSLVNVE